MPIDELVIVGAGLAGAKAAEAARHNGWAGAIRLVGDEPHLPYDRPPLSKAVLQGRAAPSSARLHDDGFYATNGIDLLVGARATAIDLATRAVVLAGGRRLRFDRLVLATGSSVRPLRAPGAGLAGVHYLRGVDDTLALRDALLPGRRVAVIGGSWIGTEVAAAARQRGCDVVVIHPGTTLLERPLGPAVGGYYARIHRDHGVSLRLGARVSAIEGDVRVRGVRLRDASLVEADVVVVGIGVTPGIELAREAGLETGDGVVVDACLRASHPDVFAAGDIAEAHHPVFGGRIRVEHWANALNQGALAGANAAGRSGTYERIPYFYSDQYDSAMEYSGWPGGWDRVVFRGHPDDGRFLAFYLAAGRIVGGASINVREVNAHVQSLVRRRAEVDPHRLADPSVDLADLVAGLPVP